MKTVLIILLIFLILFSINKISTFTTDNQLNSIMNKLYNGDKLNGYRLADIIFYPDYLIRNHRYSTLDHTYKFKNTIGSIYIKNKYPFLQKINSKNDLLTYKEEYSKFEKYLLQNKNNIGIDIDLLNEIIEKKDNNLNKNLNLNKTLFLHVRVGDVLCNYDVEQAYKYSKVGDTVWWNNVYRYAKNNDIDKVIIIAGTHFKECLFESAKYLEQIKSKFKLLLFDVEYRIGNTPDDDLIFCKYAKHFITTGGGYGYFLGNIIKLNGGKFVLYESNSSVRNDIKLF